ncbi:MAG: RICIN domain-containing protein [Prolixibacteraceae bacterium]|jgi:hypothetical protein|nr:RICIN domain-containing protein [Prolixibacteraceae bacterium]
MKRIKTIFISILLLSFGAMYMNDAYAYEHEVWESGNTYYWKTFDVQRGSSSDLAVAVEGAMGSGNRDIHVITSGTLYSTINVSASGVRLWCHNNTFTCSFSGSGILNNGNDGFEIHDLTLRNVSDGYGIRSSASSNLSFTNVIVIDIGWLGIRIDSRTSDPWDYTIYNVYMKDCRFENTGGHGLEIYSVDGLTLEGTMTARNTGDCGVLLDQCSNGTIETVDAYDCAWGSGYAGLRYANGCSNITTQTLYADRCGRGFFIVQSGPTVNCHVNYAEIRECSDIGIWIEDGTDCSVKSGCCESGVSVSGSGSYANVSSSCDNSGVTIYQIKNRSTGLYLDGMGRTNNGAAAGQWANTTHVNSQWEIISTDGYNQLRNVGTGLFLDGMGRTNNGADCGQWANTTHVNSQWSIESFDGNYVRIQNRGTGLFLDGMGRTNNGDAAGQWANSTHPNAQWELVFVSLKSASIQIASTEISSEMATDEKIELYPNPVSSSLSISISKDYEKAELRIFDLDGKMVLNTIISGEKSVLNLDKLESGIYMITIIAKDWIMNKKIVKQ